MRDAGDTWQELAHLASAAQVGFIAGPGEKVIPLFAGLIDVIGIAIAIGVAFGIPRIGKAFMVVCLLASGIPLTTSS